MRKRVRQTKRERERKKDRTRLEITHTHTLSHTLIHTVEGFCGGETVPCRRTPPFFLKRGLPDHNGGLEKRREEQEEEGGEEAEEEEGMRRENTGQSFDHVAAANRPSGLHHEADSEAGI